jgi:hypothetical protein
MNFRLGMIPAAAGVIAMAGAALAATPPVHVAGTPPAPNRTSELDWRVVVGIDADAQGPGRVLTGVNNDTCVAFDQGCPAGTRVIDSNGYLLGCTANCGGQCKVCSGSVFPASLCVRKPGGTCDIATTSVDCGLAGYANCFTAAPGTPMDNRGCWCAVPESYQDEQCFVRVCMVVP